MLQVRDLMTRDPTTIHPEAPLSHVVAKMKVSGCRQLPVVENGTLVGIITDRDVRLAFKMPELDLDYLQRKEGLDGVEAGEYMTEAPITITPDTPAARAAEMLSLYKFGALPVMEDDKLIGIITVTDFLDYMATRLELAAP